MKVLYVVGSNLSRNTSSNISHNAFVKGLLENDCQVDIIMSSDSWGEKDDSLPGFEDAKYYVYDSGSRKDKFKEFFKKSFDRNTTEQNSHEKNSESTQQNTISDSGFKKSIRSLIKKLYNFIFNHSHPYNLERSWLKNGIRFKETSPYDLIISNSSPAASHKLELDLISKKRISKTRWIQIWDDPWFFDLYGGHSEEVKKEEHRLLQAAQEIYFVSLLTLDYQKEHFPDCANKMKHIPLPYLKTEENKTVVNFDHPQFGYFGNYYSKTRNLRPFYDAVVESEAKAFIVGDTDLSFESTKTVRIYNRMTLDKLSDLQQQTDVLVHLCNVRGGQIPGKIYHYSATSKPILFILDGTPEEIVRIKAYFCQFNRYIFCENQKDDILRKIAEIKNGTIQFEEKPVLAFSPKQVVNELITI